MSTRTPARHRGPVPRPPHPSGDPDFSSPDGGYYSPAGEYLPGGDRDPRPAPSTGTQPPWAEFDADDTDPGSTLLSGEPNRSRSVRTGDTDPGSALLAGDLDHGPSVRNLDHGPSVRNNDLTRGLTVRIADLPPRSRRRGGHLSPRRPRRARYLIALLLVLPVLGVGGYYLVSGNSPAAPASSGTLTDHPAPASCAPAQANTGSAAAGSAASAALAGAMGPAVLAAQGAAPCAGQPFGAVTASPSVPQSAHPTPSRGHRKHPVAGGPSSSTPSSSASSSSSPSSSAPPSSTSPSSPAHSSSPTSSPPSASPSSSSPAGATSSDAAGQVLALINQARSSAGLAPLTVTAGLDSSASTHNSTMASGCGLSHQCPGEPDLGARETAAGVHWTAAGENIGEGGPVANSTSSIAQMAVTLTQSMLNEKPPNDGHRQNILSTSFTHIGIAVFRDSSGTVWLTQDFSN
jgi:uncharacterized protein YkwD